MDRRILKKERKRKMRVSGAGVKELAKILKKGKRSE